MVRSCISSPSSGPWNIDVRLFTADISPLQHLHHKLVESNRRRTHPSKTQTSELSDVQRLVKEARKEIIDPVFVRFPPPSPPSSDDEPDPEILKRQREHEKIRELKKMKIRTSGLKLPGRGMRTTAGVFIRHDVEDESMEVDISEDPSPPPLLPRPQPPPPLLRPDEAYHHPLDANSLAEEDPAGPRPDASSVPLPQYHFPPRSPSDDITSTRVVSNHPVPAHAAKSPPVQTSRTRRSSRKNANAAVSSSIATDGSRPVKRAKLEEKERLGLAVLPPPSTSSTSTSTSPSDVTPIALPSVNTPSTSEGGGRGGAGGKGAIGSSKPKPETYKQAWSVSEQHLLEQLLEEIPDGEKFRCVDIACALVK